MPAQIIALLVWLFQQYLAHAAGVTALVAALLKVFGPDSVTKAEGVKELLNAIIAIALGTAAVKLGSDVNSNKNRLIKLVDDK